MKFGISKLSIIPVRFDSNDQSEMTTQLIFGEHYRILESKDKWSKIEIAHDKYIGWICNKQNQEISEEEYQKLESILPDLLNRTNTFITNSCPIIINPFIKYFC